MHGMDRLTTRQPSLGANATLRWPLIRGHLDAVQPASILELGTGTGGVAIHLASRAQYVGIEPDDTSREIAESQIGRGARLLSNISELEENEDFDLACAFEVLEHIADDARTLSQWREHVRPGGHVLVSVPADQDRFGPWDELVGHLRRYSLADLVELFTSAGLSTVDVKYYGYPVGITLNAGYNWVARRRLARSPIPRDLADRTAQSARNVQLPDATRRAVWHAMAPFRLLQRRYPDRGVGLVGLAQRPGG